MPPPISRVRGDLVQKRLPHLHLNLRNMKNQKNHCLLAGSRKYQLGMVLTSTSTKASSFHHLRRQLQDPRLSWEEDMPTSLLLLPRCCCHHHHNFQLHRRLCSFRVIEADWTSILIHFCAPSIITNSIAIWNFFVTSTIRVAEEASEEELTSS